MAGDSIKFARQECRLRLFQCFIFILGIDNKVRVTRNIIRVGDHEFHDNCVLVLQLEEKGWCGISTREDLPVFYISCKRRVNSRNNPRWIAQSVLPNSYDPPALPSERAVDFAVTPPVPGNLQCPKAATRFWHAAVPSATVPETTIHEHGNFLLAKNEIGFSKHELIAPPTGNAVFFKYRRQLQFRVLIS